VKVSLPPGLQSPVLLSLFMRRLSLESFAENGEFFTFLASLPNPSTVLIARAENTQRAKAEELRNNATGSFFPL